MKSIFREMNRFIKTIIGRDYYTSKDNHCNYKRFGSEYGGWDIVIDKLDKYSTIYSVGVGEDASFDIALIDEIGVTIHAFDPTPKSIRWVETKHFPPMFIMHEYGIADFDGFITFYPPENSNHVSHTILERVETKDQAIELPVKKLKTIMRELQHGKIDVLKMDIEGAEDSVIKDMKSANIRPKQLLIEFHHRFTNVGIRKTKEAIQLIKKMGYGIFSISKSGEEYGFLYNDG